MAPSNYPNALDNYPGIAGTAPRNAPSLSGRLNDIGDAVEVIEATLGTNPQGTSGTVANRLSATTLPTGMIVMFGGSAAPAGWLLLDGSTVSRSTYNALFTALGSGTLYGQGDGSTTFNLPDLRQRFPIGRASSGPLATMGATGGALDHLHTVSNHNHTQVSHVHMQSAHTHPVGGHTHPETQHLHTVSAHTHPGGVEHTHTVTSHAHGASFTHSHIDAGHKHNLTKHFHVVQPHPHNVVSHSHGLSGSTPTGGSPFNANAATGTGPGAGTHSHGLSGGTANAVGGSTDLSLAANSAEQSPVGETEQGIASLNTGGGSGSTDGSGTLTTGGPSSTGTPGEGGAGNTGTNTASSTQSSALAATDTGGALNTQSGGGTTTEQGGAGNSGSSNPPYIVLNYIVKT